MIKQQERIANLSQQKQALLALRLAQLRNSSGMGARNAEPPPRGLRAGSNGGQLVAYIVPKPEHKPVADELRSYLQSRLPDYMVPAQLVFLDALPRTPNGKLDRRALPSPQHHAQNGRQTRTEFQSEVEKILTQIWADVLGFDHISVDDDFFEVGGDSILSIQIIARAHRSGLHLTPNQIFDHPTIAELAAVVERGAAPEADQGLVTGPMPLLPIQHWFFEQELSDPHHWNQAVLLKVPIDLNVALLDQAVQRLMHHHDVLRTRYQRTNTGWSQAIGGSEVTTAVTRIDLSHVPRANVDEVLAAKAGEIQAGFTLSKGPLFRAALFEPGSDSENRLLLVAHHLVIDAVSWRILLEDLETLYGQLTTGAPMALPVKTSSFQTYAKYLSVYARSDTQRQALAYWLANTAADVPSLPTDDGVTGDMANSNDMASQCTVSLSLNEHETASLLRHVPAAYNTRITDILLTALVQTLGTWLDSPSVLVGLEGHGREAVGDTIDLSRTVGWFTTFFPILLHLERSAESGDALKSIKEQLRRIPDRGMSYGLLRYLHPDEHVRQQLAALPQPQVLFNYLGQLGTTRTQQDQFVLTEGPVGSSRSPKNQRQFLLEINAQVVNGRLSVNWSYSHHFHHSKTIQQLAERYQVSLQSLIAHCLSVETGSYTPSDFPLARLEQAALDRLVARANQIGHSSNAVADLYLLSPMQELMLLHAVSTPHVDTLLTQIFYTLKGKLDVHAFQTAWQKLVDRHTALRTGFLWDESHAALQIVYRQAQLPFVYQDLRGLSADAQQVRCQAIRQTDQVRGFNLAEPPLMRITLIQLEEDEYELIWTSHHLILDRWCIGITIQELSDLYAADTLGQERNAPPAPPFRNYIAWIQQQDQQETEQFWRERLAGCTGPTPLGVDTPLAPYTIEQPRYAEAQIELSAQVLAALHSVVHGHHLTLSTLLQGAWGVLLSCYSQETEVIFGVAVSGRPPELAGVEAMMGSFVNNLPIHVSLSSETLIPWLKALQEWQVNAQAYAHTSLVHIQEWSGFPQRMPLFETLLIYQAPTAASTALAEHLQMNALPGRLRTNYPLTVVATDTGDGLSLGFVYDTRRFSSATITQMMKDLASVLAGFAANPDQSLSQFLCLPEAAQQQLVDRRPVQSSGVQRNGHATASPTGARPRSIVAPRDVLEHQLMKIWEQILEVEPIGIRDSFFALGGHSLLAIRLFSHIETAFGKKLPATLLAQAATIEQLAEVMRREEATSLRPLVTIQNGGSGRPLFYISPPGENMLSFAYFVHHLGADRPSYGLQPLGLNGQEVPYTRAEDMAAHFIGEMQGIQPEGPYLLTGTCFGGMVAVEMARQLQAQGQEVAFLALFDTPFPNPTLSSKIKWHLLSLGKLDPKERANYILERLKRRGARVVGRFYVKRNRAVPAHLRDLYAQAGVAQAVNRYIPQQYRGKITLFCAEGGLASNDADNLRWRGIATDGVEVHLVPGEHSTMMSEPHVHILVRKFQACLAQARADEGWAVTHEFAAKEAL